MKLGLSLFAGYVPWGIIGTWLGYRWNRSFIIGVRRARERHRRRVAQRGALKAAARQRYN